ncbi:MAG TPA: hypothetical protein VH062_12155 [Polyangiaceae bacterium]|jgi:hypothetical protein|nr:hypothetical protein [Polyangiaceae bacterium]
MTGRTGWLRRVALGMLLSVLLFAALTARIVADGEAALERSNAAFDKGDLRDAILYARRAAVLYAPGAPHVSAAYARLRAIALGAEATKDLEIARQAWGATRAAALETTHFVTPRELDLERANASLARLSGDGTSAASDPARAKMAAALARDDAPQAAWVLVLGAGFVLFAAGLVLLVVKGVSAEGEVSRRGVVFSLALTVAGVVLWTLAVYRA